MSRRQRSTESTAAFPAGSFLAGAAVVCLALAASAIYGYSTLARLRVDYLESRGQDLVSLLDAQTRGRGPGGRADVDMWQSTVDEFLVTHGETLRFLEVVNSRGDVVARAGAEAPGLFVFEHALPTPRRGGQRGSQAPSTWRVRAGLDGASTAFITRAANTQVFVSAVAIVALMTTAAFLLRGARRYLQLEAKEQEARHLADLGRMAATLSHEIRNPLGAVKGLTQVASEKLPAEHDAQQHLRTVVHEAERLERLVTDLLRFARPSQPELSRFDLFEVVEQVADTLRSGAAGSAAELLVEGPGGKRPSGDPLWISSDRDGVRQVLLNVLLNAVQADADRARVHIGLDPAHEPGRIAVIIDDDGPGLEGRDPEELFAPFSTTKTRGSGLGLAVSRQIIEQLGGTIGLRDRQDGGAQCTIVLPVQPAE